MAALPFHCSSLPVPASLGACSCTGAYAHRPTCTHRGTYTCMHIQGTHMQTLLCKACTYKLMHADTHIHMHTTHKQIHMHNTHNTHMCICIQRTHRECTYENMCIHKTHMCICTCVFTHRHVHTRSHICMHTGTHRQHMLPTTLFDPSAQSKGFHPEDKYECDILETE